MLCYPSFAANKLGRLILSSSVHNCILEPLEIYSRILPMHKGELFLSLQSKINFCFVNSTVRKVDLSESVTVPATSQ